MKKNIISRAMKSFTLLVLTVAFILSCKKDNQVYYPNVEYHNVATTQFVQVGKANIAYRVLGNNKATPLVMISALGNSMDDWDPAVTNGLAQQYKVIIFDIEGVGSSSGTTPNNIPDMAGSVVNFIHALGYNKVNVLGFSMGSFVTEQIALTNPGLVNKIILAGTGPKGAEGLSNLPNILATTVGLTPEQVFLASFFAPSDSSQAAGKLSYERIQKRVDGRDAPVNQESLVAGLTAVLGWAQPNPDALNELKKINKPVLIAQGEKDFLVPVVNAINMANSIPGAKLIVYTNAAHGAIYQYHDQFVQSAFEFLNN